MFPVDYLKKCQNTPISISLVNGTVCSGILTDVDAFQNMTISEATVQDINGTLRNFETTMIRGSSIKNISMSNSINEIVKEFRAKETPMIKNTGDNTGNNQNYNNRGNRGNYRGGGGNRGHNRGNYRGGRGGRGGK